MTWDADPIDLFTGVEDAYPFVPDSAPPVRCSAPRSRPFVPSRAAGSFGLDGKAERLICYPERTLRLNRSIGWLEACSFLTNSNYSDLAIKDIVGDDPDWPENGALMGLLAPGNYYRYRGFYIKVFGNTLSVDSVLRNSPFGVIEQWVEPIIFGIEAARRAVEILAAKCTVYPEFEERDGNQIASNFFVELLRRMDEGPIKLMFDDTDGFSGMAFGRDMVLTQRTCNRVMRWKGLKVLPTVAQYPDRLTAEGMRTAMLDMAKFVATLVHECGHLTYWHPYCVGSGVYNQFEGPDFRTYRPRAGIPPLPRVARFAVSTYMASSYRHWFNEWLGAACRGLVLGARADDFADVEQSVDDSIVWGLDQAHVDACEMKDRDGMTSSEESDWRDLFGGNNGDGYGGRPSIWEPCYSTVCTPGSIR